MGEGTVLVTARVYDSCTVLRTLTAAQGRPSFGFSDLDVPECRIMMIAQSWVDKSDTYHLCLTYRRGTDSTDIPDPAPQASYSIDR